MTPSSPQRDQQPADRFRRLLYWGIGLLLLLIVAGFIFYRSATFLSQAKQPQQRHGRMFEPGSAQPVGVAKIGRGDIRVSTRALGTVTPLATITVNTQISGVLTGVAFKEGQMVRKNQLLAQIDPRPYQIALEQYQAQLVHDDATLKQAQMDLARYQTLLQQNSIARQTVEDQVWTVKQDEGTVGSDQAQIKAQQLNLTYCRITSPVDGRVGLRQIDPGNYVQTSTTTGIAVVTQLDPMSVEFSVPEDALPAIQSRLQDGAALPVTAYDRANVRQLAQGKLAAIDSQVDTTTGTVKLRALFDNPKGALFPNQFVNVTVLVDTLKDSLTVPASAVQRGAPGTYVYVVKPDNTVAVRTVQLGEQDGDSIAVNSGLDEGEQVVTDGADRLRDGAKVSIPGASPRAGGNAEQGPGQDQQPGQGTHHHRHHPQGQQGQPGQWGSQEQPSGSGKQ